MTTVRRLAALCFGLLCEFVTCGIILLVVTWIRSSGYVLRTNQRRDRTEEGLQKLRKRHLLANVVLLLAPLPLFAFAFTNRHMACAKHLWMTVASYSIAIFNCMSLSYFSRIMSRIGDVLFALNEFDGRKWLKLATYSICHALCGLWVVVELLVAVASKGRCTYELNIKLSNDNSTGNGLYHFHIRDLILVFCSVFLFILLGAVVLLLTVKRAAFAALQKVDDCLAGFKAAKASLSRLSHILYGMAMLWVLLATWCVVVPGLGFANWAQTPLGSCTRTFVSTLLINFVALNYIKPRRKTILIFEKKVAIEKAIRKATLRRKCSKPRHSGTAEGSGKKRKLLAAAKAKDTTKMRLLSPINDEEKVGQFEEGYGSSQTTAIQSSTISRSLTSTAHSCISEEMTVASTWTALDCDSTEPRPN